MIIELWITISKIDSGVCGYLVATHTEKEAAGKFIPVIVKQSEGDLKKITNMISKVPLIKKYFSISSPEVLQAIAEYRGF